MYIGARAPKQLLMWLPRRKWVDGSMPSLPHA